MKRGKKNKWGSILGAAVLLVAGYFFIQLFIVSNAPTDTTAPTFTFKAVPPVASSSPQTKAPPVLPAIQPAITQATASVIERSSKDFAYAHGTVAAHGKLFVGMASRADNPFPTNTILVYDEAHPLVHPVSLAFSEKGDIETMVYDRATDRVYFALSNNGGLHLYALNPSWYSIATIISTTSLDIGRRPAIVTDGTYIYGITNTVPSTVFRVKIVGGELTTSASGHIPNGHSAALATFGSTTELYFGGGSYNGFEKTDPLTLQVVSSQTMSPCNMSDDMPFLKTDETSGYVYIGCETVPYGIRVNTADLSFDRFSLPGSSLGLFVFGGDIYNAAQDSTVDFFQGGDVQNLKRYRITGTTTPFTSTDGMQQINEILLSPTTGNMYLTVWWGIQGLFKVSTSTSTM